MLDRGACPGGRVLHALAYNLGNFLRTLALPEAVEHWSLTTLREKLVKIGANVVSPPKSGNRRAAEGMPFPWRWNAGTILPWIWRLSGNRRFLTPVAA